MLYKNAAAALLLGATALSSQAFAQEAREIEFGLRAQVEHNSNVARTNEARATLRGLTLDDTIFTPQATLNVVAPVGRQAVFLRSSAGYSFYNKNDKLNRERLDFTGGMNLALGPCHSVVSGGYARGINIVDDPLLIEDVENTQERKQAGVNVTCTRPTGFGVVAGASKEWSGNDLAALKYADYERTSYNAGVTYSRPALGVLTLFVNQGTTNYVNRPDGYDLTSYGLTYERQLGARIEGAVTLARSKINPTGPLAASDSESTTYALNVTYRASDRLRMQASFDRSVTPSTGFGRVYDLGTAYRLSGEYDLGSRITIGVGGARVERETELGVIVPGTLTDSSTDSVYATVKYRQSQRLVFALNAGREERNTNEPQFDYTNERIGIAAEVAF